MWLAIFTVTFFRQASPLFSRDFAPAALQISAPEVVQYYFCIDEMKMPVTVSGTDATVIFSLFTKDYAAGIRNIRNGYLGWHYVNLVDTCIYVSAPYEFSPGTHEIVWDGRASTGTRVGQGEYYYYLWAYDHEGTGETVSRYMDFTPSGDSFLTHDSEGYPLVNPVFFSGGNTYHTGKEPTMVTRSKWIVGSDPYDESFVETTSFYAWIDRGALAFYPDNKDFFFSSMFVPLSAEYHGNSQSQVMRKFRWVPNGEAQLQKDWGEEGVSLIDSWIPPEWFHTSGVFSDGDYFLHFVNMRESDGEYETELVTVDIEDGQIVDEIDLGPWWIDKDDADDGGLKFAGPATIGAKDGYLIFGSHSSCLIQFINIYLGLENKSDFLAWENGNGDFIGDRNFREDALRPWLCHDSGNARRAFSLGIDKNNFVNFPAYDIGDVSFGLLGPDGTGIGYFTLAGENSITNPVMSIVDYGSAYDGMYYRDTAAVPDSSGIRFVGSDCIQGIIVGMWDIFESYHYKIGPYCTGNIASLSFTQEVISFIHKTFSGIIEIGVFSPSGMSLGMYRLYRKSPDSITVIVSGDDPISPELDGIIENEPIILRIWDYDTATEYLVDAVTESGELRYHQDSVTVVDSLIIFDVTGVHEKTQPQEFSLSQNYPNPFNAVTSISFNLPQDRFVTLKIFNVLGEEVETCAADVFSAGTHTVEWDAATYSNGIYLYRLEARSFARTKKLMLLK